MNRQEFMKRLEELLTDISQEEREEAIAFYTGYFEDAGVENEEKVIQELEYPEKLAASIKAGLKGDEGIYTESGYQQTEPDHALPAQRMHTEYEYQSGNTETGKNSAKTRNTGLTIVLIVLIAIVTSPIWVGLLSAVFGVLMGIFGIMIGAIAGLAGLTCAGVIGGFGLVGAGIGALITGNLAAGMFVAGLGALFLAVGLLCMILLVLLCGRFLPWLVRGMISLFQKIFHKRKRQAAA